MTRRLLALLIAVLALGCAPSRAPPDAAPLEVVDRLDLERYLGTWYEIAKYPNRFEAGLVAVKAEYAWREDGSIRVVELGARGVVRG